MSIAHKIDYTDPVGADKVNPIALRKAKIVCNFGLSECNRVNDRLVVTGYIQILSNLSRLGFYSFEHYNMNQDGQNLQPTLTTKIFHDISWFVISFQGHGVTFIRNYHAAILICIHNNKGK